MSFSPYLMFRGQAREALTYYARIFEASDLRITTFAEMPGRDFPPAIAALVMHGQFSTGPGSALMAADVPEGWGEAGAVGAASIFHAARDAETVRRLFEELSAQGQVVMPLTQTFWTPAFAVVIDRFGTRWRLSVAAAPGDLA